MLKVWNIETFCRIGDIQKTRDPIAAIFPESVFKAGSNLSNLLYDSIVIAKASVFVSWVQVKFSEI